MGLQLSRQQILLYWAGTPNQHRQTNCLHRQMRIGAAQREISRANSERFLAPGYGCAPRADWLRHYSATVLPNGTHLLYKTDGGLWWLGKFSARTSIDGEYLVRFLNDPGPIKLPLSPAHHTTSTGGVQGSWCLQLCRGRSATRGIQSNVHQCRGAGVASRRSGHHCPRVFDPVFPVLNFASSGDIRFCSGFFIQFSWRDFPGNSPPEFDVAPAG